VILLEKIAADVFKVSGNTFSKEINYEREKQAEQ